MFNPTLIIIEAFIRELRAMYERTYGILEPEYPAILSFAAQLASLSPDRTEWCPPSNQSLVKSVSVSQEK
jgi:hypothetical protein